MMVNYALRLLKVSFSQTLLMMISRILFLRKV